jgi:ubiquitin carboxyl-terminal hydrolase 8
LPLFRPLSPTPFCPLPLAHAPLRVRCCPVRHPALNSGTAFPKELQTYLRDYNVLLLDVRNRADFDKAHIRTEAVICVKPIILRQTGCVRFHSIPSSKENGANPKRAD